MEKTVIDRCVQECVPPLPGRPRTQPGCHSPGPLRRAAGSAETEAQRIAALGCMSPAPLNVLLNHRTNVELTNRLVCFNIRAGQAAQATAEGCWSFRTRCGTVQSTPGGGNHSLLWAVPSCSRAVTTGVWRFGDFANGHPTGITQNIRTCWPPARSKISSNSDFIYTQSGGGGRQILAKQHQPLALLCDPIPAGEESLLFYSNGLPFIDRSQGHRAQDHDHQAPGVSRAG